MVLAGADSLPSAFAVTALASASIGAAALTVSELVAALGTPPPIVFDRRLAGANAITGSAATARPCGCADHSEAVRIAAAQPPASTTAVSSASMVHVLPASATAGRSAAEPSTRSAAARWRGAFVWSLIQPSAAR